ncbi:hypothetical protein [Lactiplantibacillus herbarum]|uniref:hypothetical protein n=1 Tax=Lactiplantibacillus herbarum TaxID=1670446 RepID=UPI00064E9331|nr:hypothetical protein [Lactiplantibacillus herbarum]
MGMLSESRKNSGEQLYETSVKPNLLASDGNTHVIMITSFSKFTNQTFDVETKYTDQLNPILANMQYDGYHIIDVKFNSMNNEGLTNTSTQFQTMIIYK